MIYKNKESYVEMIKPIAKKVGKKYSYLSSVLCAQCILETGYGGFVDATTESMIDNNNHLGMKSDLCNSNWKGHSVWNGKSFLKRTPEWNGSKVIYIDDNFRIYDSVEQCLEDFCRFMTWMTLDDGTYKYRDYVIGKRDPATVANNVRLRGYCTDPNYSVSIERLIKEWDLTKLDDKSENANTKKLVPPKFIDNRAASRSQVPAWRDKSDKKYIVVHYLGVVGQNFELWNGGYGATFTIAWNGDVYYTADYTAVTWQCGGSLQGSGGHTFYQKCTNYNSVSIETCVKRTDNKYEGDDDDDKWYFTEESQESLVWAVSKMMDDLNIPIERVIRHFDVTGKICPNPYVRNNGLNGNWTWNEFKSNLAQYRQDGTITIPNRSTPTPSPSKGYLSKGDTGEDVKTLQTMLNACGFNCGNTDGIFGNKTESALSAFRQAHKMTATPKYTDKVKAVLESAYKKATGAKYSTVFDGVDYSPVYNYTYYKKKYPTVAKALGTDKQKYFDNFIEYGMKAGRQGSAAFNVQNYKKRYEDLRKAFGDNLPEYYKHYCVYGKKEKRNAK